MIQNCKYLASWITTSVAKGKISRKALDHAYRNRQGLLKIKCLTGSDS